MFERIETLLDDLHAFAADPAVAAIPFSFSSHESGAALLQLAAGRPPAPLKSLAPSARDCEAARRFLAYVVFDRKNSYFTLLCAHRDAPEEGIRDNYRRLIALVHPDANPIGFPADAASRVNLGYAVLSNAEARASYAESLDRLPAVSGFAEKAHPSEPNGARGGSRRQRPPASRGLFAWIKRPRFGFGLLALAMLLILPVVFSLANMANDTGGERLISGGDRSEKRAARSAETSASRSTISTNPPEESKASTATENNSSLTHPLSSNRADNPVGKNSIVVAATDPTQVSKGAPEQGAVARANRAAAPVPITAFASNPTAMRIDLAPPSRLLDQAESATAVSDHRTSRVTVPQSALPTSPDEASRNISAAPATAQTTINGQPMATAPHQPLVAPRVTEARGRDAEDALLRFGSAYEQGSIDSVRRLFASTMLGRSQLLTDYQRVFANTRQRSIRFLQLKHTVAGQRVTTVGQAVVNIVGADNQSSSQRVFLEIEVARDGNDVRIERMSNYALD